MSKGTKRKKGNKICPEGIAWAKRTFDRYPSAYANMAASKYCKDPNYAKKSKREKMDSKKLKEIASQLRKASAMHKGQASKIDRMIKSMGKANGKKK